MERIMESWIMRLPRMICSRDNISVEVSLLEQVAADLPDGFGGVMLADGFL